MLLETEQFRAINVFMQGRLNSFKELFARPDAKMPLSICVANELTSFSQRQRRMQNFRDQIKKGSPLRASLLRVYFS
jgi:hypothetical protein